MGIVMDVLWEVRIKDFEFRGVGGIPRPTWHCAVLDSSEFVVLNPKIAFQNLGRGGKA